MNCSPALGPLHGGDSLSTGGDSQVMCLKPQQPRPDIQLRGSTPLSSI